MKPTLSWEKLQRALKEQRFEIRDTKNGVRVFPPGNGKAVNFHPSTLEAGKGINVMAELYRIGFVEPGKWRILERERRAEEKRRAKEAALEQQRQAEEQEAAAIIQQEPDMPENLPVKGYERVCVKCGKHWTYSRPEGKKHGRLPKYCPSCRPSAIREQQAASKRARQHEREGVTLKQQEPQSLEVQYKRTAKVFAEAMAKAMDAMQSVCDDNVRLDRELRESQRKLKKLEDLLGKAVENL